jgi:hypothetical protein
VSEGARNLPTETCSIAAAYREACIDRLMDVDDAWQRCCDAIEPPRRSYELQLVSGRAAYRTKQARVLAAYGEALDDAWATYKQQVAEAPSIGPRAAEHAGAVSRRAVIAEARARYDNAATTFRCSYDDGMASAHDVYLRLLQDAASAYKRAIDHELVSYREAIRDQPKGFEAARDGGPAAAGIDALELARAVAVNGSQSTSAVTRSARSAVQAQIEALIESASAKGDVSLKV